MLLGLLIFLFLGFIFETVILLSAEPDEFAYCQFSFPTHPECWNGGCRLPEEGIDCNLSNCRRKNGQLFDHPCNMPV